ncbi:MAG: alpha/beta hydrolase, partial [Bacteroidota bacterium]
TENGKETFETSAAYLRIKEILPQAAKSIMGQFSRDQGEYTAKVLDRMVKDKPFEQMADLAQIKVPTLVIGNEKDPLHPWEMAEAIHQEISGSTLKKVVSRYVNDSQHKKEVQAAIAAFLDNIS